MGGLNIYNIKGDVVDTYKIDKEFMDNTPSTQAVHDVVVAYLANQRSGTASTKNRSQIKASTHKPWRQKGTGRARAGMVSSPIWRGGGIVFGPQPRDFGKKVSKKLKRKALSSVISQKFNEEAIQIIDNIAIDEPKTKKIIDLLELLKINNKKVLIIKQQSDKNVIKSTNNIKGIQTVTAQDVNVYQLLYCDKILVEPEALQIIKNRIKL